MAYIAEVYYKAPTDFAREVMLAQRMAEFGGRPGYREDSTHSDFGSVCLTYEFDELKRSEMACEALRKSGEHVEGPSEYAAESAEFKNDETAKREFTAVVRNDGSHWIGWIEEIPGINCQENTREQLIETLKITLSEALILNRDAARNAAGIGFEELSIAV